MEGDERKMNLLLEVGSRKGVLLMEYMDVGKGVLLREVIDVVEEGGTKEGGLVESFFS